MKERFLFLFALLISINFIYAKNIKVLVIGNSFSVDAVENYLYELTNAGGDTIVIGNMYIGGADLKTHYDNSVSNTSSYSYRKIVNGKTVTRNNFTLLAAIIDDDWDYIALQQSPGDSGKYNSYFPYLTDLITYIKLKSINPEMKIIFHTTWAFANDVKLTAFADYGRNQMTMYNAIIDASTRAVAISDIEFVVPAGTAIQNGRSSSLGDTFCRDGYHLQLTFGRFTAACTWYEKLFGKSVLENSYIPPTMSYFQAKVARHAAHEAVSTPNSVTSLAGLTNDTPVEQFTGTINISFANNPQKPEWNVLVDHLEKSSLENLRESDGSVTPVSISVTNSFRGVSTSGATSTTRTLPDIPVEVLFQSFYGNAKPYNGVTEPTGALKVTGLNPSMAYDFTFFATMLNSRDNKECYYKFFGSVESGEVFYLNASNNTLNPLKVTNIKPNTSGEITIEVGAGPNNDNSAQFYYITALLISSASGTHTINTKASAIKIYPNVVRDYFTVETADESPMNLRMINMSGKTVIEKNIKGKESLYVGNFAKGIYLIHINDELIKLLKI